MKSLYLVEREKYFIAIDGDGYSFCDGERDDYSIDIVWISDEIDEEFEPKEETKLSAIKQLESNYYVKVYCDNDMTKEEFFKMCKFEKENLKKYKQQLLDEFRNSLKI
ncbi:hypothetical protein [uncultured Clostridium sp.]|uniref:hypothetical protein n=1 Tax=uncultured Clostridium sp. TaxID=59620 RepID=UPI003216ACEB